jgi:tetratricopeptide (TPR) repeat protein
MAKDSLETLCKRAQEALSRGEYQESRETYQQALGYRSDSPEIHYGMATACFLVNDLHSAVYHFKEVIRLDPTRAGAFINLGAVYNRLGQLDEALSTLRRGIQLDPSRGEGYYNLGLIYKQLGQLDMAINAYREAVRLNPRMYDAHYNLGNILMEKQQYHQAAVHYRSSLDIRPNWEKGRLALDAAQAELDAQKQDPLTDKPAVTPAVSLPSANPSRLDPSRLIDPNIHGKLLRDLHRLVVDTDSSSQAMLDFLQKEVEEAIRDLSICMLTPNDPSHNLTEQIRRFDEVVTQLQQLQDALQKRILRTKLLSEQVARI